MSGAFPHLFQPITIAGHTIRNRTVFTPHGTLLGGFDHLPSAAEAAYFAERAAGGVGLIVVGTQMVAPNSVFGPNVTLAADERVVPGYRAITEAIHAYGAKALAQFNHLGRQASALYPQRPLWAPSAIPCPFVRETPKEMDEDDIHELLAAYEQSARNARAGNFDGVELYAAHGALLSSFLSPHSNQRTDDYGGSLEHRLRLVVEALRAVRAGLGSGRIVGVRLNGDDYTPGGLTAADAREVAVRLAATGLVDYLHITGATYYARHLQIADMSHPTALFVSLAAAIKRAVSLPVITVNRIPDPALAEQILAEGHADLVGLVRALVADPEWPNKARRGQADRIRYCVGANVCHARVSAGVRIGCIYNPVAGNELDWGIGTLERAREPKRVLIVGAGPAGLECARVAALRGHQVTLCERADDVGGQLRLAARPDSRRELAEIVSYFRREVDRLGIQVRLGREVTRASDEVAAADVVVVATGARPLRSGYTSARPVILRLPGVEQDHVLTLWEALAAPERVGRRVAIVDDQGDVQATSTAELLADRGCEVTIVTRFAHIGSMIYSGTYVPQRSRLAERGVRCQVDSAVSAIEGRALVGYDVYSQRPWRVEPLDTIVLAMGCAADAALYHELEGSGKLVHAVGDCVAPRSVGDVVYDAHRLGRQL